MKFKMTIALFGTKMPLFYCTKFLFGKYFYLSSYSKKSKFIGNSKVYLVRKNLNKNIFRKDKENFDTAKKAVCEGMKAPWNLMFLRCGAI